MTYPRIVALSALFVVATGPAAAEDLVFMLDNQTSAAVDAFYASPADVDKWEENILAEALAAGGATRITIADGRAQCTYDLRFVYAGGEEQEERDIDLCETGSYTLSE